MIRRIFLDVDDVLNTFTLCALREVGCKIDSLAEFPREVGFDIVAAANKLLGYAYYKNKDEFWAKIGRAFWASVPKSAECDWLIDLAATIVGKENVCLLTSPTNQPDCVAGKLEWIHSRLPPWLHRQFLIGPYKHGAARPDSLLIDDSADNVKAFVGNGGQAFLFPRPWNECKETPTPETVLGRLGLKI